MAINYKKRTDLLKKEIEGRKIDSFLVTKKANVSYLSGFQGDDSIILASRDKLFFITDSRYVQEASDSIKGYEIVLVEGSVYNTLAKLMGNRHLTKLGFESMDLAYGVASKIKETLAPAIETIPARGIVESLRAVKDQVEVRLIKNSIKLAKRTFDKTARLIRPGMTEESIAREIELEFISKGARPSFEPIVASGANSSKPHARPSGCRVRKNDFIMIDIGCSLRGYCSDLTRMVIVGKVQKKFIEIYDVVRAAQTRAIESIRPGVKIADIDIAARGHIQERGFGKYFGHAVGHGVGAEVHEEPSVSRASEGLLKPGMVFTVEPAIYIPGFGGVRIEDMVLVTESGYEVLT